MIPWSETSYQPHLLQSIFKLLLAITFKLRAQSPSLLYSLAVLVTLVSAYRLHFVLAKTHMFNELIYRASVLLDAGILHLLVFFIVTAISPGEPNFIFFVGVFLPLTSVCALYLKERFKRVYLSQLMNDSEATDEGKLLCYLYLIFLYTEEKEEAWQQLI